MTSIKKLREIGNDQIIYLVLDAAGEQVGRLTTNSATACDWANSNNLKWIA